MSETLTITASEEIGTLAQAALDLQDACNGRAVARVLVRTMDYFADLGGTQLGNINPVTMAIQNKLAHLANAEQSRLDCFSACGDLAEGRDVVWPIADPAIV